MLSQNTSPLTKRFPQSRRYSFSIQPPEGSSALVFSWKVLPSALTLRLSHDCPTVSFGLEFLHPVPRRLAMCLLLGVPPIGLPGVMLRRPQLLKSLSSHCHPRVPSTLIEIMTQWFQQSMSTCPRQNSYFSSAPSPTPTQACTFIIFCLFWPCRTACGDLSSPDLGWHPHSWFEVWRFNHWTTWDVLSVILDTFHPFLVSPPLKYFRFAPCSPISLAQEILAPLA